MKFSILPIILATGFSLSLSSAINVRAATMVDIELAFVIDGSDSAQNFDVQKDAYVQIFSNPNFFDEAVQPLADSGLGDGKIAVALFQFSFLDTGTFEDSLGNPLKNTAVDWTLIESQTDADNFANKLRDLKRIGNDCDPSVPVDQCPGGERSPIGAGIDQAVFGELTTDLPMPINVPMDGIVNNEFESLHGVLDLSSDGLWLPTGGIYPELDIDPLSALSAAADQPDVSILNIITSPIPPDTDVDINELNDYLSIFADQGKTNLSGEPGFIVLEPLVDDYERELYDKILRETATPPSTPEPSLLLGLLGLGLFSLGSAVRKK